MMTYIITLLLAFMPAGKTSQRGFATPQEAIQATIEASEHDDMASLRQIFGTDSKNIVESGDSAADQNDRAEFVHLAHEKTTVNQDPANPDRVTFSIGNEDWPFPVPLERRNGQWFFDSAQGEVEILAHRIGENELNVIDVCRGFAEAEFEYASRTHDGSNILEYAQRFISSPGKQDGLYWDDADSLVPRSFADAATAGRPYHGYYFRVLTGQGANAQGGTFSYIVDNKMIGGFAMVAWPAEYGVSGIKTFMISHSGNVYEKDLGANTAALVKQMTVFDPDPSWHESESD
jgi:DUF2950 family protein